MQGILKVEPTIMSPKIRKKRSSDSIPGKFKISRVVKAENKFIAEYIDRNIPQNMFVFLTTFKALYPQTVCSSISSLLVLAV